MLPSKDTSVLTVYALCSELLPNDVICAKETRDLVIECCVGEHGGAMFTGAHQRLTAAFSTEFIHLISSEANEICETENKKTIAPEHIIAALNVSMRRERLSNHKLNDLLHSVLDTPTSNQRSTVFFKITNSNRKLVSLYLGSMHTK
jgi:hypothetical protein